MIKHGIYSSCITNTLLLLMMMMINMINITWLLMYYDVIIVYVNQRSIIVYRNTLVCVCEGNCYFISWLMEGWCNVVLWCVLCGALSQMQCFQVYDVHCSIYAVYYSVHAVHCSIYGVHCSVYAVHCSIYAVHCSVYVVHSSV